MSEPISLTVARIRVEIRERGTPKPEKARHGRRHHLSIRFKRCQLVFVSRQHQSQSKDLYRTRLVSEQAKSICDSAEQESYTLDHIPSVFVATKADLDLTQQVS
jgi:hypothetical protein